jgi:DDE superfamily endonuclease
MPMWTLPPSVAGLLAGFAPCFTAPTFQTFTALACGFLAQTGPRTVTGMLLGTRLSRVWSHDRAHSFFARARWSADQLGLGLVDLLATVLLEGDAPLRVVVDDTLMRRSGRKVFGAGWHHDPLAAGRRRVAWGNNWVVLGVLVDLPFVPQRCSPQTACTRGRSPQSGPAGCRAPAPGHDGSRTGTPPAGASRDACGVGYRMLFSPWPPAPAGFSGSMAAGCFGTVPAALPQVRPTATQSEGEEQSP